METIRIPRILNETARRYISQGKSIGFVPTMGALHNGHLSLVKRARQDNHIVIVSIFVNPLQFGEHEDFDKYPRDIEGDKEKLVREGVDILFMPDSALIYPPLFSTQVTVKGLSDKLCGAFRPGHFNGVTTVVCKLFNIIRPTRAYFGQKDFQQTVVIRRMIEDLQMGIELIVFPTIREQDGLAMSSRNIHLNPQERKAALSIYKALFSASKMISSGSANPRAVTDHLLAMLRKEPLISEVQYAGVYNPDTLNESNEFGRQNLVAVAVKIGANRLIDNVLV